MGFADKISNPKALVTTIVLVVIGMQMLTQLLPTLIESIINLSGIANMPFVSFFAANGVVLLLLGAGIIIGLVQLFMGSKGR